VSGTAGPGVIPSVSMWATSDNGTSQQQVQEVTIPEVAQRPDDEVVAELEALGLVPVEHPEPDPQIPAGHVISSDPIAGKRLALQSEVHLVGSTGLPALPLPNATGMSAADGPHTPEDAGVPA